MLNITLPEAQRALPLNYSIKRDDASLQQITQTDIQNIIPSPERLSVIRTAITCVALAAIVLFALQTTGHLHSFPQDVVHAVTSLPGQITLISIGATVLGGVGIIAHLVHGERGRFFGNQTFQPGMLLSTVGTQIKGIVACHIDTSVPKPSEGEHILPIYNHKQAVEHASISTMVFLAMPLRTVAGIIYQVARLVLEPLHIFFGVLYEIAARPAVEQYHLRDIVKGIGQSMWDIVRSPFYMTAMMMATFYSFIDPMHGRKLGALIEEEWCGNKRLDQSVWIAACMNAGLTPDFWKDTYSKWKEGTALSIPGCWRPIGYVVINEQREVTRAFRYPLKFVHRQQEGEPCQLILKPIQ